MTGPGCELSVPWVHLVLKRSEWPRTVMVPAVIVDSFIRSVR